MTHFACKYIGLPWVAGAQGPDEFDCWGMVRWILKHEYGIDVPAVNVNPDNLRSVLIAFKKDPAFRAFNEVEKPQDGDVVLLRQSKHPVHAGLWLDADGGGVLHCCRDAGVIFQDLPSMRLCGWQIDSYDREVSKNGSLSARIYEVCAERDGLKGQVRDYERVRRAIGPEQADRILEAAYQQEQVEKEQKWGARSKIRVGAR